MKFINIATDHPHLNEVIEAEPSNHGAPFNEHHYDGLPWANGMDFRVLAPSKIAFCGELGNLRKAQPRKQHGCVGGAA